VLVLESGRIVERGSPGELRRAGGRYAHCQDYLLERSSDAEPTSSPFNGGTGDA
jgi:hypothetical protein